MVKARKKKKEKKRKKIKDRKKRSIYEKRKKVESGLTKITTKEVSVS